MTMTETISSAFQSIVKEYPDNTAIELVYDHSTISYTYSEFNHLIQIAAKRLLELGLVPGERIGIVSENKPEWLVACLAILEAQGTAVLFDQMLSPEDFSVVLKEADISALFVSNNSFNKFGRVLPTQNQINLLNMDSFISNDYVTAKPLTKHEDKDRDPQIAFIAYTSGTGGIQRGVMLTHQNILLNVKSVQEMVETTSKDRYLCLLPLNHMFSISSSVLNILLKGGTAIFLDRLAADLIVRTLQEKGVTGFSAVPRLYESLHKGIFDVVEKKGKLAASVLKGLLSSLFFLRTKLGVNLGPKILKTIHKKFGNKIRFMACGGAPLAPQLLKDFQAMGFTILVGYGLTETSPIVSANTLKHNYLFTVGIPNQYSEVMLANTSESGEGEVCVRGPCVMKGYFRQPEFTRNVIVDNWFHTGDLGKLDANGSLSITGRIKELIVLSSGKKIAPESIESFFINIPTIKDFAIVGLTDSGKFGEEISAAVVVDNDKKFPEENYEQYLRRVSHKIMQISSQFPAYEHIQRVYFVESIPKTTTLKVKRNILRSTLASLIPYHFKTHHHPETTREIQNIDSDQYLNGVIEIIHNIKKSEKQQILPRTSLQFDLSMDSLDRLNLQHDLEKRFGIRFKNDVLFSAERVDDVANIVRELQQEEQTIDEERLEQKTAPIPKSSYKLTEATWWTKTWSFFLNCVFDIVKFTYNLKVIGLENVPKHESFILAANHTSNLDGFWVMAALPWEERNRVYSFMKQEYFDNPFTRKIVTISRAIPVRREGDFSSAINDGMHVLVKGNILLIFPEGARSSTGRLSHFHHGTAHLALKAQTMVIPVCIDGGYHIYPTFRVFPRLFDWRNKQRYQATVTFCKPIYPIYYQTDRSSEAILTSNIQQEILKIYKGPA